MRTLVVRNDLGRYCLALFRLQDVVRIEISLERFNPPGSRELFTLAPEGEFWVEVYLRGLDPPYVLTLDEEDLVEFMRTANFASAEDALGDDLAWLSWPPVVRQLLALHKKGEQIHVIGLTAYNEQGQGRDLNLEEKRLLLENGVPEWRDERGAK